MSQVDVERFLGRIITDGEFRELAKHSLASVCYGEGFVLSVQELSLLGGLDFSRFAPVAELLDGALRRR